MADRQRFVWAPVAAAPGQDPEQRRLGAELPSPTGEAVRGHMVELLTHQRRANAGHWQWSVGIYRDWGVSFTEAGAAYSSQDAADEANFAVPKVIAQARAHDEREAALEAILSSARAAGPDWVPPAFPIEGRDETFLRTLIWRAREEARGRAGAGIPQDTGLGALIAALSAYLHGLRVGGGGA